MNPSTITRNPELLKALRLELLRLARLEDQRACEEASKVPYWAPYPESVTGHRTAARLLHAEALALPAF
jgi:hypothetical protein